MITKVKQYTYMLMITKIKQYTYMLMITKIKQYKYMLPWCIIIGSLWSCDFHTIYMAQI